MSSVIEVRKLSYRYEDDRFALEGINFTINPGDRLAILGPNGAGKSTLLHLLAGLKLPTSGRVMIHGLDIGARKKPAYITGVGILFQDPDDQIFMPTVEEDVAFGPINMGLPAEEVEIRVEAALNATGLSDYRKRIPHHLSLGEKKRVAIAGVLAMKPDILLLDEPTANLDPRGRKELIQLLRTLDCTILMATHDLDSAMEITDGALLLDRRLLAEGSYPELLSDPELLTRGNLEMPDIPALFSRLKATGSWNGEIPLTTEEAVTSLIAHLSRSEISKT